MTWVQPAISSIFATSFAVMGALERSFLSCLAYGKHGKTAVMRLAEAILQALMVMRSSIKLSFTGSAEVCRMKTSSSLTESRIVTQVSPLEKRLVSRPPTLAYSLHQSASGCQEKHKHGKWSVLGCNEISEFMVAVS